MSIRHLARAALATVVLTALPALAAAQVASHQHDTSRSMGNMKMGTTQHPASPSVTVYKEKDCDCCGKWAAHLRKAGFPVKMVEVADVTPTNLKYAVPEKLRTCHTATVAGYVVVGHVPADVIDRLLTEKPKDVVGISSPGMPMGSPGMEEGGTKDHYDILTFDKQGNTTVYARR